MSRGLGIKDEPLKLLSQVEGLDVKKLPYCQDCCGFGGTFAVKMSSISETMVDEKVKHIEAASKIRVHTIENLDSYLDQLATNVRKNGGHVHFAFKAEDAVSYVS